jgi:hypothetical protein
MNDRLRQHRSHPYFPNRFQLGQRDHNPFDLFKPIAKRSAGLLKRNGRRAATIVRSDASGLTSGGYFYRIKTGDFAQTKTLFSRSLTFPVSKD